MTNGLVKGRLTYYHENGVVYQSFNNMAGGAKIMVYININPQYVCCAEHNIDHPISSLDELKIYADEYEAKWAERK